MVLRGMSWGSCPYDSGFLTGHGASRSEGTSCRAVYAETRIHPDTRTRGTCWVHVPWTRDSRIPRRHGTFNPHPLLLRCSLHPFISIDFYLFASPLVGRRPLSSTIAQVLPLPHQHVSSRLSSLAPPPHILPHPSVIVPYIPKHLQDSTCPRLSSCRYRRVVVVCS